MKERDRQTEQFIKSIIRYSLKLIQELSHNVTIFPCEKRIDKEEARAKWYFRKRGIFFFSKFISLLFSAHNVQYICRQIIYWYTRSLHRSPIHFICLLLFIVVEILRIVFQNTVTNHHYHHHPALFLLFLLLLLLLRIPKPHTNPPAISPYTTTFVPRSRSPFGTYSIDRSARPCYGLSTVDPRYLVGFRGSYVDTLGMFVEEAGTTEQQQQQQDSPIATAVGFKANFRREMKNGGYRWREIFGGKISPISLSCSPPSFSFVSSFCV